MMSRNWGRVRQSVLATCVVAFLTSILFWVGITNIVAQETTGRLVITSIDASSAPEILLRAYAMNENGEALPLNASSVSVEHGGQIAQSIERIGEYQAGTFTIFLVDITLGVESFDPAVREIISLYGSPENMVERVDFAAVFQIDESGASELMSPANFHNAIINFLADPMEIQTGPTALLDSLAGLLGEIENIKPKGDMLASIVLFSDGTDIVSEQFDVDEVVAQAALMGVPVHTIWLENNNVSGENQLVGRDNMNRLAAGSGGLATTLDQRAEQQAIWDRIASFRNQASLIYRPEELVGGTHEVMVSLRDDPTVQDKTTVTISAAAPSIAINLPPDSRQLTLETLDTPVRISLSTTLVWLDGEDRELENAQLIVNGIVVHEIPVDDIERFTVDIDNFSYGPNTIQIAVVDELGQTARSSEFILAVLEGRTELPEEIEAPGLFGNGLLQFVISCFLVLLVVAILALIFAGIRRWRKSGERGSESLFGRLPFRRAGRPQSQENGPRVRPTDQTQPSAYSEPAADAEPRLDADTSRDVVHYLEILESVTRMPQYVELSANEHQIGRAPARADILFENDITVSRLHAAIIREGSDYRIYDSGSSSGTWVNEQQVPEYGRQLMDGDEIRLGDARMLYRRAH